jgi:thiamine biosynthesis lipoprotein ApbE
VSTATISFPALGTTATLCVAEGGRLEGALPVLERELLEIDAACSRFRPDSELAALNAAAGTAFAAGPRLLEAIEVALRAAASSHGLVDPTIGRSLRLAGYDRSFELVRARDRSAPPRFAVVPGWQRIEVDRARGLVRIPAGVELDLGATAKALAADRAATAAALAVECGILVSLGGDVAVAGEPPQRGWAIRLADDHSSPVDGPGPTVSVRSGGLASSGTTVRRWRAGEAGLHHIIDPRTGRPAVTPWRTVSVAAVSCVDANVASTAAVVLGRDAPAWLARHRLPARLVRASGSVELVAGWPA